MVLLPTQSMENFEAGQPTPQEQPTPQSQPPPTLRDDDSRNSVNRLTYQPGHIWERAQQRYTGDTTVYQSRLAVERRVKTCRVCARAVTDTSPHGHQSLIVYCSSCGGYHKDCLEKVGFDVGVPDVRAQSNLNLCTLCYMKSSAKESQHCDF